jgi:tetratricopeptide (TPR) repeat protein
MPSRLILTRLLGLAACACLLIAGARARAGGQEQARQPPSSFSKEVADGVALYRQGDYENAVKALKQAAGESKGDPDAWHFLSLAYEKRGKTKDARKASEKAVLLSFAKLVPKPIPGEDYEKLSREERASRRLKTAADLRRAAEIVEDYLTLQPRGADFWRAQLDSLRFHAEHTAKAAEQASVFFASDLEKKAQITDRPDPLYTKEARENQVTGTVRLSMVLAADGTVKYIFALTRLPDGLTESSIRAARSIKFIPAMKDGHPVSQFVTIEYSFDIY